MGNEVPVQILTGEVAERVRELVRETCEVFEIRIVKGVVSKDHVHILTSCAPTMAPSEIMRRIKGRTSSKLFEGFSHLKKRYWGKAFLGERVLLCYGGANDRGDDQAVFGASF